jgi:hypothetical protein
MGLMLLMMTTETTMRQMENPSHGMFHFTLEIPFRWANTIFRGINDLPVICRHFAQLVRHKTWFIVSFMFAGPDPRNNWDMMTLSQVVWITLDLQRLTIRSCHPLERPQGKSFPALYETADRAFLEAFQQYAEQIFHKFLFVCTGFRVTHQHVQL